MPPKSSTALATTIPIVLVERNGNLHASNINAYTPLELAKKCKFKTASGFEVRAEWAYSGSTTDERFMVELWAREDGTAGQENKYEFPPPVDTILFFGTCALVAKDMSSKHSVIPLTLEKWDKMYNFLFGGFDSLVNGDDDEEEDELDSIPAHRKTKDGYLKDGFVVDSSEDDDEDDGSETDESDDEEEMDEDEADEDEADEEDELDNEDDDDECPASKVASNVKSKVSKKREKKQPKEEVLVDTSSELSEEAYEYIDD